MGSGTGIAEGLNKRLISDSENTQKAMQFAWPGEEGLGVADPQLVIDVHGFEGPLDLLLHLARNQKVDLSGISILALVEQYLAFVEQARRLRLELAADYLVMAAWLAYLKSRLLVPSPPGEDEGTGEELAEMLQFRLRRLEAMRDAAAKLFNRNRLGRDIFRRGDPEMVVVERKNLYSATLYELLTAYTGLRQRQAVSHVEVAKRTVWSLKNARQILERILGEEAKHDWLALDHYLTAFIPVQEERVTAMASAFAASLEMVREGTMEIRQADAFAPLYIRVRQGAAGNIAAKGETEQNNG